MHVLKKLSVWQKIAIAAIIVGMIVGGSYYIYIPPTPSDITNFQPNKHSKQIIDIFNSHRYWLVADPNFPIEFTLKYRTSEQDFAHVDNMKIRVLEHEGRVDGFITYYMKRPDYGRVMFLAVRPEVRGKRYGEQLMHYAMEDLIKMGAKKMYLVTRVENYSAQALYKRLGFVETGWRKHGFIKYAYTP